MQARQELGAELGNQHWLFREGGLVVGPLTGSQLVEKLYAGEVSSKTEVAPAGENGFRPIAEIGAFRVHVAKAEAKARVDAVANVERDKHRRKLIQVVSAVGVASLVLATGAWQLARYAAVHGWLGSEDDAFADISVEPPTITLARARADEELVEYRGNGKRLARAEPTRAASADGSKGKVASASARKGTVAAASASGKMSSASDDPDGLQTATFDQAAISGVVAKHQRSLFGCFADEAKRQPGLAAKVPIEFVIGNDGRVAKLWVDHPQFKQGPLYECLFAQLQKWPFKPSEGERPTVGLSFKIGRPG